MQTEPQYPTPYKIRDVEELTEAEQQSIHSISGAIITKNGDATLSQVAASNFLTGRIPKDPSDNYITQAFSLLGKEVPPSDPIEELKNLLSELETNLANMRDSQ